MHLGRNNPRQVYYMNGEPLEQTEEETDIGVKVTPNLKPAAQCQKAARTAQTVLGQLARSFHYRDRHVFLKLYKTYVRPHLEFSVPVWSPWQEGDIETLEKVQKCAVRMISGMKSETYEEKLAELGLTTLAERRHQQDMLQVYKIVNGKDNVKSEKWFTMATEAQRTTRAAADPLNLRGAAARSEIRRNFFSQRVVNSWNRIPADLKAAKTAEAFRKGYASIRDRR